MDPDDAVMLTDVVPTGYQAAEMGGIQPGDTVAVFGAGPVGIMAARCAGCSAPAGSSSLTTWSTGSVRRSYANAEVHDFRSLGDPVVFLKRTTDSLGADVCIDAVGAEAAGRRCRRSRGGR